MITDKILDLSYSVVELLLSSLPDVILNFNASVFDPILNIIRTISYFFPMGTVSAILIIVLAVQSLRVGIAMVKTIMEIIPFV